jgi:hypothetical protein
VFGDGDLHVRRFFRLPLHIDWKQKSRLGPFYFRLFKALNYTIASYLPMLLLKSL